MTDPSPWWKASVHADRRPALIQRNRIVAAIRSHFAGQGFEEVEPAALQISPGNETHLHAFATELVRPSGDRANLYLHTSPEFAMKKLLAAGEERLVALARVWRNRERGPLHHPEFTMLEWYRANAAYTEIMDDCVALLRLAATITGCREMAFRGRTADPFAAPQRLSVANAFSIHAGIDLMASIGTDGVDRSHLAGQASASGIRVAPDDTWSDIFSRVLVERIEPNLGTGRPTILDEYPVHEAALARPCPHDARLSERFEVYVCGVELANAFGELTDADEQRRRFEAEMSEKARIYGERYPIDEDFLAALEHMPPASGAALGLDRLVLLATGAQRIDQVIWTPVADRD